MTEPAQRPVWVRYDDDGAIVGWGAQEAAFTQALLDRGEPVLFAAEALGDTPASNAIYEQLFVDRVAGEVKRKGPSTAALSGLTLSGLPSPSFVAIGANRQRFTADTVDLSLPQAGTYRVTVTSPSQVSVTFEVTSNGA